MTYDYLLYDNRTLGPSGYDWNIKTATGRLQDNKAVREKFVEYCRDTFDTRHGQLSNFGAALGGIRLAGGGYLLCVTLEKEDLSKRRSCAFVGIYCPHPGALKTILTQGDPITSAEKITDGVRSNLALEGNPLVANDQLTSYDGRLGRYPFNPGSTPQNAAGVLLKQLEKGGRLPSILGIAQWSPTRSQILKRYDMAYCLGLPASAVETRPAGPDSGDAPQDGFFKSTLGRSFLGIMLCAAIVAFIYFGYPVLRSSTPDPRTTPPPTPTPASTPASTSEPDASHMASPQPSVAPSDDSEAFLEQFELLVKRFESAPPPAMLVNSPEWNTLMKVPVLSHQGQREEMMALLKTGLPEFQRAVREENFRHYLLEAQNHERGSADVVRSIREKLTNLHPPKDQCKLLRDSFSLWTESADSATGQWCKLVDDFAK